MHAGRAVNSRGNVPELSCLLPTNSNANVLEFCRLWHTFWFFCHKILLVSFSSQWTDEATYINVSRNRDFSPQGQQALQNGNFSAYGDTPQEYLAGLLNELQWTPEQISDYQTGNVDGAIESYCTTSEADESGVVRRGRVWLSTVYHRWCVCYRLFFYCRTRSSLVQTLFQMSSAPT